MDYSYDILCSEELEAAIEKTWEKVHSLTQLLQNVELHLAAVQQKGCV